MADNTFRTFRRGANPGDADPAQRDFASDPLAELARLIGQGEAHGQPGHDFEQPADTLGETAPTSEFDWAAADEAYAARHNAEQTPLQPPRAYRTQAAQELGSRPRGRDEPDLSGRKYFAAAAALDDALADARRNGSLPEPRNRTETQASRAQPTPYVAPADAGYSGQTVTEAGDQVGAVEDQSPRPRRSGTILLVTVLGLAVLGGAGALGYRAMFGGSIIPSFPPIIKPANTPVKIVPDHEAKSNAQSQADAGAKGTGDQLVSHEEKPVDVQPANPTPHVTTIPVISNAPPSESSPDTGSATGQQSLAAPPAAPAAAPSAGGSPLPDWATLDGAGQQQSSQGGQLISPRAPPSGSKPVRTVTIRPDQGANSPSANVPEPAARPASTREPMARPGRDTAARTRETEARASTTGGPLSIIPNGEEAAPPADRRARIATTHSSSPLALNSPSAEPPIEQSASRPTERSPSGAGGYSVQVSSQRSEAEAMAAFRSLQAKYPQQLGNRRAVIRRADLGARGVFYRALVGPFASGEDATRLCSSLKAAGGGCIIQRD